MPEQLREAMESALTRRQAMERAFDDLSTEGEGDAEGTVSTSSSSDTSSTEQVIKTGGDTTKEGGTETSPIIDESKKPIKPLGKPGSKSGQPGKGDQKGSEAAKGAKTDPQQPATSKFKAPNTWKPDAREHWNTLPERIQEEISRREGEVTKVLNETAAARRWAGEFQNIVRPFEGLIRASGATPMQAVNNLMNTAATLQMGTVAQKVAVIRDLITLYKVDLPSLDAALAGKAPPGKMAVNDEVGKLLDERLKPVNDFIRTVQGSRQQSQQALFQEVTQTAEQFENDPKNEFFNDLRHDIADILDLAANRGREMTLEQAYNLAAKQHPEISKVLAQRETAAQAAKDAQSLARSRRAASSQPAGAPGGVGVSQGKPANRREAISQAWDDLSAR